MNITTQVIIKRINSEQRWKDLSRPAFISPANRGEIAKLLQKNIKELEKFNKLAFNFDKKS